MRIEIDEDLEEALNKIKSKIWISGKGHSETIRFLAKYYMDSEDIKRMIQDQMDKMDLRLENGIQKALRNIIINLIQKSST